MKFDKPDTRKRLNSTNLAGQINRICIYVCSAGTSRSEVGGAHAIKEVTYMKGSSQIPGFYKLSGKERIAKIQEICDLSNEECETITNTGGMQFDDVDKMIENVVGTFDLPMGIAMNFQINGKDYLIPMATEEPSVVAAASNSAKLARVKGGFSASATDQVMIGQIQIIGVHDPYGAQMDIYRHKQEFIEMANAKDPVLVRFGGGVKDIDVRVLPSQGGDMIVVHLLVDTKDAMGANAVNTMAEAVAPRLEELTGGEAVLRIISNLAIHRLARAKAVFSKEDLGGEDVVDAILNAYYLADADPFRATTHNKGIMNGISALVRATGNDTRAVEAGAHAFAAFGGEYMPLTRYEKNKDGDLVGTIELPTAVGLVGGATKVHPVARAAVKILGVKSAAELGMIIAAVGLAQNIGALRALATEGIQRGHMKLHARNIALMALQDAGKPKELAEKVVAGMLAKKAVRMDVAEEVIKELGA